MSKSHGHARKGKTTRTYRIWTNMKTRCTNRWCLRLRCNGTKRPVVPLEQGDVGHAIFPCCKAVAAVTIPPIRELSIGLTRMIGLV